MHTAKLRVWRRALRNMIAVANQFVAIGVLTGSDEPVNYVGPSGTRVYEHSLRGDDMMHAGSRHLWMAAAVMATFFTAHFSVSQTASNSQACSCPPVTGATVDSVKYDQTAGKAEIVVRNTSPKDISAFDLNITDRFASGVVDPTEFSKDFLQSSIAEETTGLAPEPNYKIIGPGETRVETFLVPTRPNGEKPLSVRAIVDAVVFTDRTGEATNKAALQRMLSYRKAYGTALLDADQVIRKHLESRDEQDVEENIRLDLKQHQANAPAVESIAYDSVLVDVENAKRTLTYEGAQRAREKLQNAVKAYERQARLYLAHCVLAPAR